MEMDLYGSGWEGWLANSMYAARERSDGRSSMYRASTSTVEMEIPGAVQQCGFDGEQCADGMSLMTAPFLASVPRCGCMSCMH